MRPPERFAEPGEKSHGRDSPTTLAARTPPALEKPCPMTADSTPEIPRPDSAHSSAWTELAPFFLDTDSRPLIPRAALRCLEAGLSDSRIEEIWKHELTPALSANLRSAAGEWAGWSPEWIEEQVRTRQRPAGRRAGWLAELRYRLEIGGAHRTLLAIRDCFRLLDRRPPDQLEPLVRDLEWLAHHHFDFPPEGEPTTGDAGVLEALYRESFLPIFRRLEVRKSGEGQRRVEGALEALGRSG